MLDLHRLQQVLCIPYYANFESSALGLDSIEHCLDRDHFKTWPSTVSYKFNEIGFRTKSIARFTGKEILAIGDSFTLGLGCDYSQCWPHRLENLLQYPVLNFSLNGASNDWIARKTQQLLQFFNPRAIVIHHTFSHRRERLRTDWHDDERTECSPHYTTEQNFENFCKNFKILQQTCGFIPTIHGFVPQWHDQPVDYEKFTQTMAPVHVIDLARDGFHYGPGTHQNLADLYATNLLAVESHRSHEP